MRNSDEIKRDLRRQQKVCYECKQLLSFSLFSKDVHSADGRNRVCRDCRSMKRSSKRTNQRTNEEIEKDILLGSKVCCGCGIRKDFSEFYNSKSSIDKRQVLCIECDRSRVHKRNIEKYGISVEMFDKILKLQGGCCAICGKVPKNKRRIHIDHDHNTGKVRGLLCSQCNVALGSFNEELLFRAINYVRGEYGNGEL